MRCRLGGRRRRRCGGDPPGAGVELVVELAGAVGLLGLRLVAHISVIDCARSSRRLRRSAGSSDFPSWAGRPRRRPAMRLRRLSRMPSCTRDQVGATGDQQGKTSRGNASCRAQCAVVSAAPGRRRSTPPEQQRQYQQRCHRRQSRRARVALRRRRPTGCATRRPGLALAAMHQPYAILMKLSAIEDSRLGVPMVVVEVVAGPSQTPGYIREHDQENVHHDREERQRNAQPADKEPNADPE